MDILPIAYSPFNNLNVNIVRINKPKKKTIIKGIRFIRKN
jgi:hypothetical protein